MPPKGAQLRFTRYRFGGGRDGNVRPMTLRELKAAIPGVASVTNPRLARGGVDAEDVPSARQRAALEIRTRYRAVTTRDFEILAREATPQVARAVCDLPSARRAGRPLHVLPQIEPADRRLSVEELVPSQELLEEVAAYLDELVAAGHLDRAGADALPRRVGGRRAAGLAAGPHQPRRGGRRARAVRVSQPARRRRGSGLGSGWPYGRSLSPGELYGIVHAIEGVEFARILRVYETDLVTGRTPPSRSRGTWS